MPTDGSDYYDALIREDKKMAKTKGIGNWKAFKEPGESVLVGNPLLSGQRPDENQMEKKERKKAPIPQNPVPAIENIGGGSDKPNVKTPKSDEK